MMDVYEILKGRGGLMALIEDNFDQMDSDIVTKLRKKDEAYIALRDLKLGIERKFPGIESVFDGEGAVSLSAEEHSLLHKYLTYQNGMRGIELLSIYFAGSSDNIELLKRTGAIPKGFSLSIDTFIKEDFNTMNRTIGTELQCNEKYMAESNRKLEMEQQFPFIKPFLKEEGAVSLSAEEHARLSEYMLVLDSIERIQRLNSYYEGHRDNIAFLERTGAITNGGGNRATYTACLFTFSNGSEEDAPECEELDFKSFTKAKSRCDEFAAECEGVKFAGAHVQDENGDYVYELLCG